MTANRPPSCWICGDQDCGGWGCSSGGMPVLSPSELQALDRPRLCITCEERPALVGQLSNFCEVCDPGSNQKYRRKYSEAEEADHEGEAQRMFEHDHRWGAGPTQADVVLADYGGGK